MPSDSTSEPPAKQARGLRRAALYPTAYVWYIFLACLDIMFTYLIVHPDVFVREYDPKTKSYDFSLEPRGAEANPLADWVIQRWGLPGMVVFKLGIVLLVICICEIVGRKREALGRRLANWAVALNPIPVVVAFYYLVRELFTYW